MTTNNKLQTIFDKRNERLTLQKKCNQLEQEEKDLMYELTKEMVSHGTPCFQLYGYTANMEVKDTPTAENWPQILEYIKETGSVDLLQKRLTESAVKARWTAGVDVPGVLNIPKHVITITKD